MTADAAVSKACFMHACRCVAAAAPQLRLTALQISRELDLGAAYVMLALLLINLKASTVNAKGVLHVLWCFVDLCATQAPHCNGELCGLLLVNREVCVPAGCRRRTH
jgi:hypothetical protein